MAFHKNKSHHAGRLSDGSVNNARMASRKNKPERTGFPSDKYIKRYSRSAHVLALISTILLVLSAVLFSIEYIQTTRQYNSQRAGKVSSASVTERKRPGMVLFLASYGPSQKLFADEQEGIAGVFDESNITCETVCMNHKAFGTEQDDAAFRSLMEERMESYQDRYAGIVTADDAALKFVLDNRETMFKDIPVVYFGVSNKDLAARASSDPYIEGYTEDLGLKETIAVAQKLIPQAVRVTAVCDNTITSEANKGIFNDLSDQFPGLDFELFNFEEHTIDETTEYLSGLGDDTILLDLDAYYDRDGNYYAVDQSVAIISKAAKIPVFRAAIDGFEEGCTAGVHTDALKASVLAAQQLVGYLNGETGLDDHSVPLSADLLEYTYNDEAMRHFGLDTSVFPADTEVVNRRENFWSDYHAILIPAILAILGMAAAFLGLRQGAKISRFRAQHDALTGLYNRHTALSKLAGYSDSGKKRAIILTDIDNFKIFNETYGHSNGDRLMEEIASLLLHYCEKHGLGCCRYGGDEFLVFVKDRGLEGEDDRLIRDIFDLFKQPILLGADLVVPSASIGAANVRPGKTAEDAVLDADIALTRAKAAGKNICMFYTEDMRKSVEGITKTKNSIVSAVQNDGFYMVYQPKVDVATGNVIGYEALVRMKSAAASPAVFIPIAESTGWIRQIGRITTEKAVRQIAEWQKAGAVTRPVSINFSAAQLGDKQFIQFLKDLLKTTGVSSSLVEIEITESLFMRDSKQAEELMKEFRDMPVLLLMDDFGTGYSSLSYLTYIPVSTIKIDKSLIDTYLVPGRDSFIRDVINLSHDLGKKVTCEGVETRMQYERLKEFGCDVIQGYYFSKPLPAGAVPHFRVEAGKL